MHRLLAALDRRLHRLVVGRSHVNPVDVVRDLQAVFAAQAQHLFAVGKFRVHVGSIVGHKARRARTGEHLREGHLAAAHLIQNLQRHERPFHTGHDFSPPVKRFMSSFIPYFSIILPLPICQGEG